ncbi:MAG TPA: DUF1801 domain-containing protein [Tepidisphaeraceae bacterium]|nr:DUF1801 domain-containing protein [Tepidisphaeraceae bacterium]
MNPTNPKVDGLIRKAGQWQDAFKKLRAIVLEFPLTEDVKWRNACYTLDDANVVLMHGFKEYCALLFFKGSLLKDPKGILVRPGENTQTSRQIRFTSLAEVDAKQSAIRDMIRQAIDAEKAGLKIIEKSSAKLELPAELTKKLNESEPLKKAFEALTPGRQRMYAIFISGAKQAKTREARVKKCLPLIKRGKGLNDDQGSR